MVIAMTDPVLKQILKELAAISKDHEKRLRWLEKGAFMCLGAFALIKLLQ